MRSGVLNLLNKEYLNIIGCENAKDLSLIFPRCDSEAKNIMTERKKKNSATIHIP